MCGLKGCQRDKDCRPRMTFFSFISLSKQVEEEGKGGELRGYREVRGEECQG